jgi:hypothetical protein
MAETQANRDLQEGIKLCFEFGKHVTTLAGAGVVALVAVYREQLLDERILLFAVALFAISAGLAIMGMSYAIPAVAAPASSAGVAATRNVTSLVTFAGGAFAGGLFFVVGASIRLTFWQQAIAGVVIGLVLGVIIWARMR